MKKKILKIWLSIFSLLIFITSAIYMYNLIAKINLPSGPIYAIVTYGYLLLHIASFVAMLYYSKDYLIKQ